MKLLLDTEVLYVMLTQSSIISDHHREHIQEIAANGGLRISVASLLQLREAKRDGLISAAHLDAIDNWMKSHAPQIVPIDVRVLASMSRTWDGESVADRLLLATARCEDVRLATFREFPYLQVEYFLVKRV